MLIGYARVSTDDQNPDMQIAALRKAGCERVFEDRLSGTRRKRPQLLLALDTLQPNDTLVIWKLDRLARSTVHLIEIANSLHERQIELRSITEALDTSSPSGEFFFQVLASFAEFERDMISQRVSASVAHRKANGTYQVPPQCLPKLSKEGRDLVETMLLDNATWKEAAAAVGFKSADALMAYFPGGKRALGIKITARHKKMTPEKIEEAEALLREGMSWREVAGSLDVGTTTLSQHIPGGKAAIDAPPKKPNLKITAAKKKKIKALMRKGWRNQGIADHLDCCVGAVVRHCPGGRRALGVADVPHNKVVTAEVLNSARAMLLDDATWEQAAKMAGCTKGHLMRLLPGGKAALRAKHDKNLKNSAD